MADYLIVNQETGIIDNIIVITDPAMVEYFGLGELLGVTNQLHMVWLDHLFVHIYRQE